MGEDSATACGRKSRRVRPRVPLSGVMSHFPGGEPATRLPACRAYLMDAARVSILIQCRKSLRPAPHRSTMSRPSSASSCTVRVFTSGLHTPHGRSPACAGPLRHGASAPKSLACSCSWQGPVEGGRCCALWHNAFSPRECVSASQRNDLPREG